MYGGVHFVCPWIAVFCVAMYLDFRFIKNRELTINRFWNDEWCVILNYVIVSYYYYFQGLIGGGGGSKRCFSPPSAYGVYGFISCFLLIPLCFPWCGIIGWPGKFTFFCPSFHASVSQWQLKCTSEHQALVVLLVCCSPVLGFLLSRFLDEVPYFLGSLDLVAGVILFNVSFIRYIGYISVSDYVN